MHFNKVHLPKDIIPEEFNEYNEADLIKYEETHHSNNYFAYL